MIILTSLFLGYVVGQGKIAYSTGNLVVDERGRKIGKVYSSEPFGLICTVDAQYYLIRIDLIRNKLLTKVSISINEIEITPIEVFGSLYFFSTLQPARSPFDVRVDFSYGNPVWFDKTGTVQFSTGDRRVSFRVPINPN